MNAPPLVSVVVPAYNAERFLRETLESVLRQTHSHLELIVIDDGSTDGTAAIVRGLQDKDPRVTLISQMNSGVSAARNAGLVAAKGAFLAFLDADDIWIADWLDSALERFSFDRELGMVQCDFQEIDSDSRTIGSAFSFAPEGHVLDVLLKPHGQSIFCISGVLVRREAIDLAGAFDPELSNGADHDFFFRVASRFRVGRVPRIGVHYRLHPGNMHSNVALLERDVLRTFEKADRLGLFRDATFRRECYGNMYFVLAGSWWREGRDKVKGSAYLIKSLRTHPPLILRLLGKLVAFRHSAFPRRVAKTSALLAVGFFVGASVKYCNHLAARAYLKETAERAASQAGASSPRAKVLALRDFVRASVSFDGVPQEGRPFLRDSADETLRSGRGWCGEASRAFICLAKELGIRAQRINLSGNFKHTVAEAELPDGGSVIVDSQSPPTIVDLEPLDRVMLEGRYSEYYSVNLERLHLRPIISRLKLEPGFLAYWLENPRLIKATAGALIGAVFALIAAFFALVAKVAGEHHSSAGRP